MLGVTEQSSAGADQEAMLNSLEEAVPGYLDLLDLTGRTIAVLGGGAGIGRQLWHRQGYYRRTLSAPIPSGLIVQRAGRVEANLIDCLVQREKIDQIRAERVLAGD